MKDFENLLVALGCVGVVLTGLGSGVPTEIQTGANTMKLTTKSDGNNNGFTNATHWTAIGGGAVVTPCSMSAPLAPNPDAANCDYWIPSGIDMRTHKDSHSNIFPEGAKPMVVGGRSWHLGGSITPATSFGSAPLMFPDLYLYDASFFKLNTTCGLSNTTVTVMSAWNNPHYMKPTGNGMSFTFKGCTLKGEAGSGLKLTTENSSTTAAAFYYFVDSDLSGFKGELFIGADNTQTPSTCMFRRSASNRAEPSVFPGTIYIGNSSKLAGKASSLSFDDCGLMKIKTMTLSENTSLTCNYSGAVECDTLTVKDGVSFNFINVKETVPAPYVTVTNSFTAPSTPIPVTVSFAASAEAKSYPLIRDETGTLTEDMFVLPELSSPEWHFEVLEEKGAKTLYAVRADWITMKKADPSYTAALSPTGSMFWSDNQVVHGGACYRDPGFMLYFHAGEGLPSKNYVFPGVGLWVDKVDDMHFQYLNSATFTNMWVTCPSCFNCYSGTMIALKGERIVMYPGTSGSSCSFHCYQKGGFVINAPVEGDGVIAPRWRGNDHSMGYFEMPQLNTNFIGKVFVYCMGRGKSGSTDYTPMSSKNIVVSVYDQRNFGGPIPAGKTAPVYDALTVCDRQVVEAKRTDANGGNVVFDDQTRGIYVPWWSRYAAGEGVTLTLKEQITYEGKLEKIGKGTLALGGTAKFTKSVLDTPYVGGQLLSGTNDLTISEGALKPLAYAAFKGVAVTMANGTAVVVDANTSDADLAKYGIDTTVAGSSLTIADGATVAVKFGETPADGDGKSLAVAAFATEEAANAALARLTPVKDAALKGFALTLTVEAIDGKYRIVATATPKGLVLLVR